MQGNSFSQKFLSTVKWLGDSVRKIERVELSSWYQRVCLLIQPFKAKSLGLVTNDPIELLLWYLACFEVGCSLTVLPSSEKQILSQSKIDIYFNQEIITSLDKSDSIDKLGITIFTSGTTGIPKPVFWSFHELHTEPIWQSNSSAELVVSAYPCDTFAGLQAMLHVIFRADRAYFIKPEIFLSSFLSIESKVDLVMGPPAFWRREVLFDTKLAMLAIVPVAISMGGEPIEATVLTRLREIFPNTRIIHIYALSEVGSVFAVRDGEVGFPSNYIGRILTSGIELKEINGELVVFCSRYPNGYATGDLIRKTDSERYIFSGRSSDIMNIAGRKVIPSEIETILGHIPNILDAVVYAISSTISGQLVAADLVISSESDPESVKMAVADKFDAMGASHFRPRRIRFVSEIAINRAGKRQRQPEKKVGE